MVSRSHLDSRRGIIPGRVTVSVFKRAPRDVFSIGKEILAERRPSSRNKRRSSDGESQGDLYEYVFWTIELDEKGIVLREGDVIQDGVKWLSVDEIKFEMQDRRQRAYCSPSVDPSTFSSIE